MKKTIYIIEATAIYSKGFLDYFESKFDANEFQESVFIIDKDVDEEIKNLLTLGEYDKGYRIKEFISLIEELKIVEYIETKNFLITEFLEFYLETNTFQSIEVITQKNTVYNALTKVLNHGNATFYRFDDGVVSEWLIQEIGQREAFYNDDPDYLLDFNTETIDNAYSKKYGYLKFDMASKRAGGEGYVYKTYRNLVCKIYKDKHLSYTNFKKIEKMLEYDVHNRYIIWPKDILFYQNKFIGYVMEEVQNAKSLDELRDTSFPNFSILDRLTLAYHFLKNTHYLHKKGIIVGDMKFDNILVKSPKEVYIIDSGSFQIEDFPCPVFHKEFTGRQMTTDDLKKRLRDIEDEYFPINKILFEIIITKNPFYSVDNNEIDTDGPREFHYPLNKDEIIGVPSEDQKIWFNLSDNMRNYFYFYFKQRKITPITELMADLELFINKIGGTL